MWGISTETPPGLNNCFFKEIESHLSGLPEQEQHKANFILDKYKNGQLAPVPEIEPKSDQEFFSELGKDFIGRQPKEDQKQIYSDLRRYFEGRKKYKAHLNKKEKCTSFVLTRNELDALLANKAKG